MDSDTQSNKDVEQRQKIAAEKSRLVTQLIFMVFMSLLVAAAFYGITIYQNPHLAPEATA